MQLPQLIALQRLDELDIELFDHAPNSADLATSDYYLFPKLKKSKGKKFSTNDEAICVIVECFAHKDQEFFKGLEYYSIHVMLNKYNFVLKICGNLHGRLSTY